MTPIERSSIDNAVWLCPRCADLVDLDPEKYPVAMLKRWRAMAEKRADDAITNGRIANVGASFADSLLLVTRHLEVIPPIFPKDLMGPRRVQKITYKPTHVPRHATDLWVPVIGGPPPPPGFAVISLVCQNQGIGVERFVRFGLHFEGSAPAIHSSKPDSERVILSEGGSHGSGFATFLVRELIPGERMGASVMARTDVPFEAFLWTERAGNSKEVFVFDVLVEEVTPPS